MGSTVCLINIIIAEIQLQTSNKILNKQSIEHDIFSTYWKFEPDKLNDFGDMIV